MSDFYDKQGKPIELMEWGELMQDMEYKRVGLTEDLKDGVYVSTVWIGMDHSFVKGPPLIFESRAFKDVGVESRERDLDRYATLAEAEDGHRRMVAKYS